MKIKLSMLFQACSRSSPAWCSSPVVAEPAANPGSRCHGSPRRNSGSCRGGSPRCNQGSCKIYRNPSYFGRQDTTSPVLQDLADEVKSTYNLDLVVELKSAIRDHFQVAAPLGEGPDIIVIAHLIAPVHWLTMACWPQSISGDKAKDFAPQALQACTFDGTLYCLPYATENLASSIIRSGYNSTHHLG